MCGCSCNTLFFSLIQFFSLPSQDWMTRIYQLRKDYMNCRTQNSWLGHICTCIMYTVHYKYTLYCTIQYSMYNKCWTYSTYSTVLVYICTLYVMFCPIRSSCDRTGFYAKIQNNFWQLRVWGKDYKYCWTISYATFASQTWTQFRHKISFFCQIILQIKPFLNAVPWLLQK